MLTGGVDLSVATTATTGAFMISSYATDGAAKAIGVALLAGLGIGIVNGIGVAIFRVNPLIMTLGVSTVTLGALTIYSQTRFLAPAPDLVKKLGSERFFTYIPYGLLVWVPISALIILGLRYSGFGRMIYAVGDNAVACRLAGVRTWQVLLAVYALCGMLSAVAGILLVGFNDAADLGIATPFLLPSVAAVVIGGTSIFGGVGGYAGTILGALILTVLDSLLTILNASQAARQILYGLIILALATIYARAARPPTDAFAVRRDDGARPAGAAALPQVRSLTTSASGGPGGRSGGSVAGRAQTHCAPEAGSDESPFRGSRR